MLMLFPFDLRTETILISKGLRSQSARVQVNCKLVSLRFKLSTRLIAWPIARVTGQRELGNRHLRNIPQRRPWIRAGTFAGRESSRPERGATCRAAARSLAKTAAARKGPVTDKVTNEFNANRSENRGSRRRGWGRPLLSSRNTLEKLFNAFSD